MAGEIAGKGFDVASQGALLDDVQCLSSTLNKIYCLDIGFGSVLKRP